MPTPKRKSAIEGVTGRTRLPNFKSGDGEGETHPEGVGERAIFAEQRENDGAETD